MDGIANASDKCPDDPEDRDGFQDADGCPDPDNDRDGIPDVNDKCPNAPERINGFEDHDGCPDHPPVVIRPVPHTPTVSRVYFSTGTWLIPKRTRRLLDVVVDTLKKNPGVLLLEIQGHTDSTETNAASVSRKRAKAVQAYLFRRGINPRRLRVRGYGATHPLATNRTRQGRAKNRRVEFKVLRHRK